MEAVFEGRRRLLPRPTDLSFYNWVTQTSAANHTPSFQARPAPMVMTGVHALFTPVTGGTCTRACHALKCQERVFLQAGMYARCAAGSLLPGSEACERKRWSLNSVA